MDAFDQMKEAWFISYQHVSMLPRYLPINFSINESAINCPKTRDIEK